MGNANESAVARHYAHVFFATVGKDAQKSSFFNTITLFHETLKQTKNFLEFCASPIIPFAQKEDLLKAVLPKLGANALWERFIFQVILNKRGRLLGEILESLKTLWQDAHGEQTVRVISAIALPDSVRKSLNTQLEEALTRKILINADIDPNILGGLIIDAPPYRLDASVATQLNKVSKYLQGEKR